MRLRALILDFDGVIAESNGVKDQAFAELCGLYPEHREAMLAYHQMHHSSSRMMKFEYYARNLIIPQDENFLIAQLADQFSSLVVDRVVTCPAVPGAMELLAEFAPLVPLYISSVTPQEELHQILKARGVRHYFAEAYGNPPWPKKEAIAAVLAREGFLPGEVGFVGDSLSDFRAARECGLPFWGRDSGQSFADAAVDLSPDLFVVAGKLRDLLPREISNP